MKLEATPKTIIGFLPNLSEKMPEGIETSAAANVFTETRRPTKAIDAPK